VRGESGEGACASQPLVSEMLPVSTTVHLIAAKVPMRRVPFVTVAITLKEQVVGSDGDNVAETPPLLLTVPLSVPPFTLVDHVPLSALPVWEKVTRVGSMAQSGFRWWHLSTCP
jgi:hypothetical protein